MGKNTLIIMLFMALIACKEAPKTVETASKPTVNINADSAAIADVIHGFYKWYDEFQNDDKKNINFCNSSGKHLKLDMPKLETYYASFRNTGFISEEFIQNDLAMLKTCEKAWQNEAVDDVPSCLDADRIFCAQDWTIDYWVKSPVRLKENGENKVIATMYGKEFDSTIEHTFNLVKTNGKWQISHIDCDWGIH